MRAYLENNSKNWNDKTDFNKFFWGCIHSLKLFNITRENHKSTDPIMVQQFLKGSLVNNLCAYLRKLKLPDGPVCNSSWYNADDWDNNSDDDHKIPSKNCFPSRSQKVWHLSDTVVHLRASIRSWWTFEILLFWLEPLKACQMLMSCICACIQLLFELWLSNQINS